jgi:methyl-accepting chemotaxis protein
MNIFANISIGKKLMVLLAVFVAGYTIFGLVSFSTLNTLRIHGNLYNQIIMDKDLIADVLPPPGYIIESYMDVLQMADEADPAQIDYFIAELKRLQADYEERHKFWVNEPLLEQGAVRDAMLKGAYEPAVQFYDIVFSRFIPALKSGDLKKARELAHGELKTLYTQHRKSVDKVVQGAMERYKKVEALANAKIQSDTNVLFTIAFVIIGVAAVIMCLVIKSITKPIAMIVGALKDISEGEGDLTQSIKIKAKNEIGELAHHFNKLMAALRGPISEAKTAVSSLVSVSGKLSSVSTQLASGAEKSVARSDTVANTMEKMAMNINAMASGAEQASHNANDVATAAEQMSANMNTIASAIEEMGASISEIADNTNKVRKVASEATGKATYATDAMNKLGIAAKEIGYVTDVIKKIADKTNLLALNAAIEAASAGEAGKGFAVVAGEIEELANQSAKSANDIARRIEGIQVGTGNAVKVINDVNDIIVKINQSVEAIAGHAEQQTKASHEVSSNVAQANTGARRVASAISEVAKGANDVSRNADETAKGAVNVSHNVVDINQAAKENSNGASQVSQSATELSKMAGQLRTAMDKFKV